MKVAVFSRYPQDPSCPRGGVESVAVVLARALADLDDLDVHVITFQRGLLHARTEGDGPATVHRLPGSAWPQILDIIAGPGRKRLLRCVHELQPDILHTHETHGLALGRCGIPHVFTMHGFDHANILADRAWLAGIRSRLWRRIERHCLSYQRHMISITPYVRQTIEPLTGARIFDIENPVDRRFFDVRRREEPDRILSVGWISARKNTLGSVKALKGVLDARREAILVVAGAVADEDYARCVRQYTEENGLSDRIEFVGHVAQEELTCQLARASVFLLPSRQENSPMAIAEAMATGMPVIAANRCGMPYMLDEGKSGFLIDPEDTAQITDRLLRLLADQDLRVRMGREARRQAIQRFHPINVARKTRDVYRAVVASCSAMGRPGPVPS